MNLYRSVVESITTAGESGRYTQLRINGVSAIDAFAARKIEDDLEALLLEVEPSTLARIVEWPLSRGFQIDFGATDPGSPIRTRLYLQLTDERYRDVFYTLCEDVCSVLAEASGEQEAIRAFHSRLVRWQAFLKKHPPDGLSPEEQVGLFGELLILNDLFLPRLEPSLTVRAWRGCRKAHQDFQFSDRALEVKTTRAVTPSTIRISNVQQLDEDGVAPLVLTLVVVHANQTSGETLPDMVEKIRTVLPDDARERFDDGLIEVGYLDIHDKLYVNSRYQVNGVLHHEVRDGFPRLLREQLPEGVKAVQYDISIDAARPFLIDEGRIGEIFQGLEEVDGG